MTVRHGDDGGYLRSLVESARAGLRGLPNYHAVRDDLVEVARFYADLQVLKHGPAGERERACDAWYARNRERFPGLAWWEFAAACGSSLPVFALIALGIARAARPRRDRGDGERLLPRRLGGAHPARLLHRPGRRPRARRAELRRLLRFERRGGHAVAPARARRRSRACARWPARRTTASSSKRCASSTSRTRRCSSSASTAKAPRCSAPCGEPRAAGGQISRGLRGASSASCGSRSRRT